jgi:hypothetical protein
VLFDYAMALRGRLSQKMLAMSPGFALTTAEQMATQAQAQFQQTQAQQTAQGGNVAGSMGITQPGLGMPLGLESQAGGGQVPAVVG